MQRDAHLRALVARSFTRSRGTCGSLRMRADRRAWGERCEKSRIARLLREAGMRQSMSARAHPYPHVWSEPCIGTLKTDTIFHN